MGVCRDQIAGKSDVGVPHNIPSKEQFEDACSRLGIARDSHVVVYDTVGVFSSPRTAFTFKVRYERSCLSGAREPPG